MTTEIKPFFIKAITPLHVGSGSDLGVVDMPIQRESHTGFPKIEASSLKGSIRSEFESKAQNDDEKIKEFQKIQVAFGFDLNENNYKTSDEKEEYQKIVKIFQDEKTKEIKKDFSGALGFSDARILFFPVKSVKGVFAYVTCPMVLERFEKDINISDSNKKILEKIKIPSIQDNNCVVFSNTNTINKNNDYFVILEEYSFKSIEKINLDEKDFFIPKDLQDIFQRLVIISDDNFTHFVKNSTEVITRTKIDNITGTVQNGALFTEEYLPSETVMYSLAIANKPFSDKSDLTDANSVMEYFNNISKVIQIGGNSTLGKGIVKIFCEGCGNE